jgi:hypothetical protein
MNHQGLLADWVHETEFAFGSALADMDGDLESFRELGDIYAEELPRQLALFEGVQGDVTRLLPLLHEAANTLGVIGARLYARRIRDIEEDLRSGGHSDPYVAATSSAEAMRRAGVALAQWLSVRGG